MGQHPGPLKELEFWGSKAADLDSIKEQLESAKIQAVTEILKRTQSTYLPAFEKLIEEVDSAREEAKQNYKYLSPMKPYFERLKFDSPSPIEFVEAPTIFKKLFHIIYLVWNNSKYYNTQNRLVVLIREICNDLIDLVSLLLLCI